MVNDQLKAVDFFCGAGGITCGLRQAGVNVLAGIDIDKESKETYEFNNPGSEFIAADISTLAVNSLRNKGVGVADDNMIFVGCSPCQYYTIINTSKEKSEKTKSLLEDFQRFVDHYRPGYVFIENVPGLESNDQSPLEKFKSYLKKNKYFIDDSILNAGDFEVPQNRRRYVLVASRLKKVKLPRERLKAKRTVRTAIGDYNIYKPLSAGTRDESCFQHSVAGLQEINIKRLKRTQKDGGSRSDWKDDESLQLPCYRGKDGIFTDVYGRMFWDRPSPTITTKFFSISNGRFAHPDQNRAITIREGATLQSFPLSYVFKSASLAQQAKMIGNAVPPLMAKRIIELSIMQ